MFQTKSKKKKKNKHSHFLILDQPEKEGLLIKNGPIDFLPLIALDPRI
jgi:hypothetical protein